MDPEEGFSEEIMLSLEPSDENQSGRGGREGRGKEFSVRKLRALEEERGGRCLA